MTFHQRDGAIQCDTCPETIETEDREFAEAKDFAFGKGWRRYKGPDDKWADSCPVCVVDFAKSKR